MIVYWVAALEILAYLVAVPLHLAVFLRTQGGMSASAGFSLFEARFARRSAMKKLGRDADAKKPGGNASRKTRFILRLARDTRRLSLTVRGSFSTGDAASTALASGLIRASEASFAPFFGKLSLNLTPDFNASSSYADIQGMISLHLGQIIYATVYGAIKNTNRRITQWISIRSKAS
ncbi:MAG: DUF2953 domain-containing protein [Clostridiales bacterium]|nr:DUF2953 domain-containing protein [Clostridiales bacterium]